MDESTRAALGREFDENKFNPRPYRIEYQSGGTTTSLDGIPRRSRPDVVTIQVGENEFIQLPMSTILSAIVLE